MMWILLTQPEIVHLHDSFDDMFYMCQNGAIYMKFGLHVHYIYCEYTWIRGHLHLLAHTRAHAHIVFAHIKLLKRHPQCLG